VTSRQATSATLRGAGSGPERAPAMRKTHRNPRTAFRAARRIIRQARETLRAGRGTTGMIGKITAPRGERAAPLIYYLYGPGRREEHTDPHIVAGWRHPAELEPPLREDGTRDFRTLLGLLNQPHAAMGSFGLAWPVWHCPARAAPEDKMLSDDEWAQIACDVMQ